MGNVPTVEPLEIRAGDTAKWSRAFEDFPASQGWMLAYTLRNADQVFNVATDDITPDGDTFNVLIPATETATWNAGDYTLAAIVTKGLERYTPDLGQLKVLPDLASDQPVDMRSENEKILAKINAILANPDDVAEYTIQGRQVKVRTDMLKLQQLYAWRVWREKNQGPAFAGATFNYRPI